MMIFDKEDALFTLREMLNDQTATFRPGQWEAVDKIVNDQKKVLVVERTGWGKSIVYFLSTKLHRKKKLGPTIIVSPLLSLMRNQLDSIKQSSLKMEKIDSTNDEYWNDIYKKFKENEVDVLFEHVTVTKENIVDFISIINVDVYARNMTNIGDAFAKVDKISKQYEDEHVKTSHIFMTDGIPTSGITDRAKLVEKLPSIDYQYFIGFGLDHDVTLLSMFADKFANSYYFVDSIENTGNIYGEILHNIVNNLG